MVQQSGDAVLYARLSKDSTGEAAGVTRQLDDARRFAELRGYNVLREFVDNDISAAGGKHRPGFADMLSELRTGGAKTIIAWSWDRLSRNRRDTLTIIELGQDRKLTIALCRGSDMDMSTAAGRLTADMLASVARAEIDQKSERQSRAGQQRAEQGKPPSRRAFGYDYDGTPHAVEAGVVAETFALFLAGATMAGLAKKLNEDGHTTTRGCQWHDTGLRVMLTNRRYVAQRVYHGEVVAAGTWAPLVSDDTFEAVQAKLRDGTPVTRRPARRHLGSSLFLCHCGATVKTSYDKDNHRIYKCSARAHMARTADPVDDYVRKVVAGILRKQDLADLAANDVADVAKLRAETMSLRARLDTITQDYADGGISAQQLRVASRRIEDKLRAAEAELAKAGQTSVLASIATAPDLGDEWLALPLDRQRAVLAAIAEVVILPGRRGRPSRGSFEASTVEIRPRH